MKRTIWIFLLALLWCGTMYGQERTVWENGKVSFISSKNVYVKFSSTKNITVGDTLYLDLDGELLPALIVDNKSSSSTVCSPLTPKEIKVGDVFVARGHILEDKLEPLEKETTPLEEADPIASNQQVTTPADENAIEDVLFKEKVKGRISVATYNTLSQQRNLTRMRYAFLYRGHNLKNSRFSVNSYVTFRHTVGEWEEVRNNIGNALKVYALSVKYDFDKSSSLTLGRKINPHFSSMGAIDGLQYEKGFGSIRLGAIAGTRPDFSDYGVNTNLPQFGAYISYIPTNPAKYQQTTLGIVEQRNRSKTDRRFVYFQHSAELAKNLNLFGSMELDLFQNVNNEIRNEARLTNLYVSLRYRLSNKWRVSASYDNRRNIIYYESYKSVIDQLIEDETRQGLRFGITHRPARNISWGINSSMRFQKSKKNPSRNVNGFVSYNRLPFLNANATLRVNLLQTDFLDSRLFSLRLSKELIPGKLSGDIYYRWVDYLYKNSDRVLHQNVGGMSLSWRIQKRLSLNLFYEGVFDSPEKTYHRINARIIKRF